MLSFLTWIVHALVQKPIGRWLDETHRYPPVMFLAGLMPLFGLLAVVLLWNPWWRRKSRSSRSRNHMRRSCSVRLLVILSLLFFVTHRAGAEEPRSPADSMKAFVLADPALTIELVASEPDVTSPVAIAWDEDGRLYVAEMNDYPVAPASGRIRRLEDKDGDGRFEHSTVFADGLPFPNGVMPCFGGVLVTAAPNIWFLRDKDGDGRADERQVLLTGFGEGNTQLRVNGLYLGLDNDLRSQRP